MKRLIFAGAAATLLSVCSIATNAPASHPDLLRNYQFIPAHSTLKVSGGFAGVDWDLEIAGSFDLITGYDEGASCLAIGVCPPPDHIPFARFEDVDAILSNPMIMAPIPLPGWDLDQTLNLTGLDGTFDWRDPNRLFFYGQDGQGWPIKLTATIRDKFLHIIGENDPGCCDFFHYKLNALAHLQPYADFNRDGMIDAADFVLWRKLEGSPEQYAAWRTDFGADVAAQAAAALAGESDSLAAVPEPSAVMVLILTIIAYAFGQRYWRR